MTPQNTGAFIASLRKEQCWTQQALADKLNVTVKAVSRWETGKGYPDVTTLPMLSELFGVSVGELLAGERLGASPTVEATDTVLLNTYADATHARRKNRQLIRWVCILSAVIILLTGLGAVSCLGGGIILGIADSFRGRPYCILADDLSYMTYYGERYVPLDTGGYAFRYGEELVDEVRLESGDIVSKLFSEYSVRTVIGTQNNELLYLQSEHDVDCYVKESCKKEYESRLSLFEPTIAYAVLSQPDWHDVQRPLDNTVIRALSALSASDIDTDKTCEFTPKQQRFTVIAYENGGVFYKEYGDIFETDGHYYWYDYGEEPYPDAAADTHSPYHLNESCYPALDTLFSYVE